MERTVSINDGQYHYFIKVHVSDGQDLDEVVYTKIGHSSYHHSDVTDTLGLYPLDVLNHLVMLGELNEERIKKEKGELNEQRT
tara:strand:- start:35 stop:283 length:249 start_codon:yes stop_codon:yes gene_type:complete